MNLEPRYIVKQINNILPLSLTNLIYITTNSLFVLRQFDLLHYQKGVNVELINTDISNLTVEINNYIETEICNSSINQYKEYCDLI